MGNEVNTGSRDWAMSNAWKMRHYKGPTATVPGGHKIAAEDEYGSFIGLQPPGADLDGVIDRPTDFLKHPKPDCAYIFRSRQDDDTIRLVELQDIRPVRWDELKPRAATLSLHAFQESGVPDEKGERRVMTCVGWRKMAMYEVTPENTYKWFVHPGRYHQSLVTDIPESINEQFQEAGYGTAKLEVKNQRTQAQEVEADRRGGR
jgi:hypothetical protein